MGHISTPALPECNWRQCVHSQCHNNRNNRVLLCGTTSLAGVFLTPDPWSTPTAASQATLIPESVKTDFRSADTTNTTEGGHKIKRIDTLTNLVARETGKAASTVPAGPGRRQLVGV